MTHDDEWRDCDCGEGRYNAALYSSCYDCYLARRGDYVTCISCGRRWHSPLYALCYQCNKYDGGRSEREEAARTLRQQIMHRDRYTCQYCGEPAEHIDHIQPCAKGGTADPWNLQALCSLCNWEKAAQYRSIDREASRFLMGEYFYSLRGFLNAEQREHLRRDVTVWRISQGNHRILRSLP